VHTINHAQVVCLAQEAPAPRGLPEDFALQTGAYGAPTPTFLNRNSTAAGGTAAGPAGVDQPTYAQLLDNVQRLSAQVQPLINRGQVDYGGGEVGFSQEESGRGFFGDMGAAANAMGFGPDPSNDPSNSGFTGSVSGVGSPGDGEGSLEVMVLTYEVGGLIKWLRVVNRLHHLKWLSCLLRRRVLRLTSN
jgi:hypothetical protein